MKKIYMAMFGLSVLFCFLVLVFGIDNDISIQTIVFASAQYVIAHMYYIKYTEQNK